MPENQNIEWKESWRDDYLKLICAFANAQGGIIKHFLLFITVNTIIDLVAQHLIK